MKRIAIIDDAATRGRLGGHGTHLAFLGLPGVEIAALADSECDGIEKKLAATQAQRHYTDYHEMLEKEKPDIAVICSRLPGEHMAVIEAAVQHKCHIFCEKPMTASLHEADRIVHLAEANNLKVAVAHLGRYALAFRTAKRMIEEGAIGRVLTLYGRGKEDFRGGGEDMMVLGTHILDLSCFLLGTPQSVYASVTQDGRPLKKTDRLPTAEPLGPTAGDNVYALFEFPDNVNVIFESRRGLSERGLRMGIVIAGATGNLCIRYNGDDASILKLSRTPLPPEDESIYEEVPLTEERIIPGARPLDYSLQSVKHHYFAENNRFAAWDLVKAIDENRQPVSGVYDVRTALEMMCGVYKSQLKGCRIRLPLEDRKHPLDDAF